MAERRLVKAARVAAREIRTVVVDAREYHRAGLTWADSIESAADNLEAKVRAHETAVQEVRDLPEVGYPEGRGGLGNDF